MSSLLLLPADKTWLQWNFIYCGVSHYGQLIMDVISMVTFPFFNAHGSENVWPATWIQPPPHPPKMNQHWKPTINHDSRAVISYKLSFERFKMLLQRTLYKIKKTYFYSNFLSTAPCKFSQYGGNCSLTCPCVPDQYERCDDNGTCLCSPGWTGKNCAQGCI